MAGTLYLCATPIGNLEDMTYRGVRILSEVDLIAAEDTRNSRIILQHYGIKTPMVSYHEFNKIQKAEDLIRMLQEGKNIALITDAGTPGISDPGEELVAMCYEYGIEVDAIPGAAACIAAVTTSGQPCRRFCFEAFLPKDKKERARVLAEIKQETRTIVLYESPHHLKATLEELQEVLGDRSVTICRELTKKFEEKRKIPLSEAVSYYQEQEPRGEYVLVLAGRSKAQVQAEQQEQWKNTSLEEHMQFYLDRGMNKKEAMKSVAKDRGVSRRDVYQALLQQEKS